MHIVKKLPVIVLLMIGFSVTGQNPKFVSTWNFVQTSRAKIDSSCNDVKIHKLYTRHKRSKLKIQNNKDHSISHTLVSEYSSGQNIVTHKYKFTGGRMIRIVEINGSIVCMDVKWDNKTEDIHMISHATRIGEHSWRWVYRNRVFTNSAAHIYTDDLIIATINNWD